MEEILIRLFFIYNLTAHNQAFNQYTFCADNDKKEDQMALPQASYALLHTVCADMQEPQRKSL